MTGREFREKLERRITAREVEKRTVKSAPPEVLRRTINGELVVCRSVRHAN